MKEINIKIKIDDENNLIVVGTRDNLSTKGISRSIELAGVYSYLMNKELGKINTETKFKSGKK